jgi:hypothetical protein
MAFRKIIEVEGKSVVQTSVGIIENGNQRVSFSAYIKVIGIDGDKSKINAIVSFKGDTQQFTKQYQVPVSVDAGSANFIAQAYEYLKTLPEFAGATDC